MVRENRLESFASTSSSLLSLSGIYLEIFRLEDISSIRNIIVNSSFHLMDFGRTPILSFPGQNSVIVEKENPHIGNISLTLFRIPEPVRAADLYGRDLLYERRMLRARHPCIDLEIYTQNSPTMLKNSIQ